MRFEEPTDLGPPPKYKQPLANTRSETTRKSTSFISEADNLFRPSIMLEAIDLLAKLNATLVHLEAHSCRGLLPAADALEIRHSIDRMIARLESVIGFESISGKRKR